jgi:hypothetical protein
LSRIVVTISLADIERMNYVQTNLGHGHRRYHTPFDIVVIWPHISAATAAQFGVVGLNAKRC